MVANDDGAPTATLGFDSLAPNPARGSVTVRLAVGDADAVRVSLYDALGRRVATLHDGPAVGALDLSVDASRLAPGVYVLRAVSQDATATRRMTVVR